MITHPTPRVVKNSDLVSINDCTMFMDATANDCVPQLPPCNTGLHRFEFIVTAIEEHNCTIACTGVGDKFSNTGNADFSEMVLGDAVIIQSDGINTYWVVSKYSILT